MNQTLFRQEAIDRQGERLWGELILSQPVSFRVLGFFLLCITLVSLYFLASSEYRRSQEVSGILVPDRGMVEISVPSDGLLRAIHVAEGQYVEAGQPLLELQGDLMTGASGAVSQEYLRELGEQQDNLQARIELERQSLAMAGEHHDLRLSGLEADSGQLRDLLVREKQLLALRQAALQRSSSIHSSGLLSSAELDAVRERLLQQEAAVHNIELRLSANAAEQRNSIANWQNTSLNIKKEVLKIQTELSAVKREIAYYSAELSNSISATVAGTVGTVAASRGQLVRAHQNIISIVPADSALQAQLLVPTSAVGFLNQNQEVLLRYDAFPYQKFGVFSGRISSVPDSAVHDQTASGPQTPYYQVTADIDRQSIDAYGSGFPLRPGMTLSAEIILDRRSLLEWLLDPLLSMRGAL